MPSSLGEAVLDLSADDAKLNADIDKAGNNALKKMDQFGQKMRQAGTTMTAAITLPLIGAAAFTVNQASSLEESINAVNVVFEDGADIIHQFGKTAVDEVNLAEVNFNKLATVTGAFLTNLGYGEKEAAQETINLTKRAADLSSVFDTDVSDALNAVNSLLKGEFNPAERFGVKLNAAAIEAKALSMGLQDMNGDLSDNAKAQAALVLFYEQTAKVEGDLKNTQDSFANSTRHVKEQLLEVSAALGTQLLPYAIQAVQFISQLVAKFQGLSPEQQRWILMIGGAVAALGPLLIIIGSLISALSAIIPIIGAVAGVLTFPLIAIIAAVIAIGVLLYKAWTENWGGIQEKVQAAVAYIQPMLQQFIQNLSQLWNNVLLPAMQAVWGWMSGTLWPFLQAVGNFIGAVLGVAVKALAGIFQNVLWPAMKAGHEWFMANLFPSLQKFATFLANNFVKALEWVSNAIKTVTGWLNNMADMLRSIKLPAWMTPGSPTPWEIGLWGVDEALRKLSRASLPSFSAGLGAMASPAISSQQLAFGGGGQVVFQYSPMISTADEFEAGRVLGPFIENKWRELQKR